MPRIELHPNYPCWFNALHEVGHWAVKPEWYIKEWEKKKRRPTKPPDLRRDDYYVPNFSDPTPDELGVRAWSHLVLRKKHWRHPSRCYSEGFDPYIENQWLNFSFCKDHINLMNGFEQLYFAGIDLESDIYRPDPQFGRTTDVMYAA